MYHNEAGCGNAIRASGIPRDQIFFTSKVGDISYEKAKAQVDKTLSESKLDYIDLMLLHHPFGGSENRKGGWKAVSIKICPITKSQTNPAHSSSKPSKPARYALSALATTVYTT